MIEKNPASAAKVNKYKALARDVVEHHFGSRPRRIYHKSAGLSNFVFAVKHSEGDFVVRISPDSAAINSFIKEQWAQNAARKAGVPTAEILEVGSAVIPHPYMITRTVSGTDALHHDKRSAIVQEMGRLTALINSIRTKNWGATFDWSNNQLSRNKTWKEYIENEYRYEDKLAVLERHKAVSPIQSKAITRIFADAVRMKPKSALNHGDIRLKNVLADEKGKITAIIDWENSTSNLAPHWELSLALHDLNIDEKQHFINGYGLTPKKMQEIAPLAKAFNMLNYTIEVERLAAVKDKDGLEKIRLRTSGVFDLYSL